MATPAKKWRCWIIAVKNPTPEDYKAVHSLSCVYSLWKVVDMEEDKFMQIVAYYANARSKPDTSLFHEVEYIDPVESTHAAFTICDVEGDWNASGTRPKQGKRSDVEEKKNRTRDALYKLRMPDATKSITIDFYTRKLDLLEAKERFIKAEIIRCKNEMISAVHYRQVRDYLEREAHVELIRAEKRELDKNKKPPAAKKNEPKSL